MSPPMPRRDRSPDPVRDHLKEVRRGLLRLHKALIDAERAAFEREQGALSNGAFLQALIQDPYFAWLRPFSGLIVEIDEALAAGDPLLPPQARAYIARVRGLVEPEDEERYARVRQRDPAVLIAHVELEARIAAASEAA